MKKDSEKNKIIKDIIIMYVAFLASAAFFQYIIIYYVK